MPSPFPGMDPYLEHPSQWEDFQQRFMTRACDTLVPQVQPRYRAITTQVLFIESGDDRPTRRIKPDAFVVEAGGVKRSPSNGATATAVLQPPVRLTHVEPDVAERHTQIEIRDGAGRQIICIIELLSRANKESGENRDAYLAKRSAAMWSGAHFIEIDLLRTRPRVLQEQSPPPPDYYAMVSRAEERPSVGFWPIKLRDRLPKIPVPLRAPDADAVLDLQAVLDATYDAARYGDYIYRDGPPDPPLDGADADWPAGRLAGADVASARSTS